MSKSKKVKHLTWGEEIREHVTARAPDGSRICLTLAVYKTLCKRLDEESQLPPDVAGERPAKVCKTCWREFHRTMAEVVL